MRFVVSNRKVHYFQKIVQKQNGRKNFIIAFNGFINIVTSVKSTCIYSDIFFES